MPLEPSRLTFERTALNIVDAVIDLPPAQSHAQLDTACGTDAALRERVLQLIAQVHQQAADTTGFHVVVPPTFLAPPERIGHFRLTDVIGQGGMGVVCKAVRDDGLFEQTVAIKLLHPVLRSETAFQHFYQERKILARLTHPAIVGLLDGGDHEGRPYLVMQYVDGESLMDHVHRQSLRLADRLSLFGEIVDAVIHAHRQLVVHADLKPSNILVDHQGQIRLLDFGIARLLSEHISPNVVISGYTEGYAAPERKAGEPATVAGDVYSLGVILHELLCSRLPDITTIPGQLLLASTCCDDTLINNADLKGDLDAIIARALATDPQHRYPDVATLRRDLDRYKKQLPVAAHPGGWRYLTGKFLRRNRKALVVTAVFAAVVITAAAVSALQYLETATARQEADRRFFEVRGLVHYLLFELYDELARSPGTTAARVEVADTARRYLEQLTNIDTPPEDLRLDVARSYIRLAGVLGLSGTSSLGRTTDAARALDAAESILMELTSERATTDVLIETGNLLNSRWTLLADNAASELSNSSAAQTFRRALEIEPGNLRAQLGWFTTERNRAFGLLWTHNDPVAAAAVLTTSLEQLRATDFSGNELANSAVTLEIQLLTRLGDARYDTADHRGALDAYRSAESLVRSRLANEITPASLDQLGDLLFNISGVEAETPESMEQALSTAREGIQVMERLLSYGPDASAEKRLLVLLGQEANVLSLLERHAEAVTSSERSVAMREQRQSAEPENPLRRRDLAIGLGAHVDVLNAAKLSQKACAAALQALVVWADIEARGHLSPRDASRNVTAARERKAKVCAGTST